MSSIEAEKNQNWYVVRSKPKQERKLAGAAIDLGLNVYLPLVTTYEIRLGKKRNTEKLLISGYVFVAKPESGIEKLNFLPHSIGLLKFNNAPAYINTDEIERIKQVISSGYDIDVVHQLSPGDKVRIKTGPLQGIEGFIGKRSNTREIYIESGLHSTWIRIKNGSAELEILKA